MARAFGFDGLGICVLLMGDRSRNEKNKIGWAFVFDGRASVFDGLGICVLLVGDRSWNKGRTRPKMKDDRSQNERTLNPASIGC